VASQGKFGAWRWAVPIAALLAVSVLALGVTEVIPGSAPFLGTLTVVLVMIGGILLFLLCLTASFTAWLRADERGTFDQLPSHAR
jgi:hypothetical protein